MTQLSVAAFLSVSRPSFSRVWAHLQQDPKGNSNPQVWPAMAAPDSARDLLNR